jgi:hypothetical protein
MDIHGKIAATSEEKLYLKYLSEWRMVMAPVKTATHTESSKCYYSTTEECRQSGNLWPTVFPNLKHLPLDILVGLTHDDTLHSLDDFLFQCLGPKVAIMQEACKIDEARIRAKQVEVLVLCERCRMLGLSIFSHFWHDPPDVRGDIEGLSPPACAYEVRLQKLFEDLVKKKI